MATMPQSFRPRIRSLMAAIAFLALIFWVLADPLPRFRAWWPNRHVLAALDRKATLNLPPNPVLGDLVKGLRMATASPTLPQGIPVYIDPAGLTGAGRTMASPLSVAPRAATLGDSLRETMRPLGLTYEVRDGLLHVVRLGDKTK